MATRTNNLYGRITVSNRAIKSVANLAISECYGVAKGRVTYIEVDENKIETIYIRMNLKFGVTPLTVAESVRSTVKYHVEKFTGMTVRIINIILVGIE